MSHHSHKVLDVSRLLKLLGLNVVLRDGDYSLLEKGILF